MNATHAEGRRHFEILDGLRGIAASAVVLLHLNETFHWTHAHTPIVFGHAYLAVEFFILLMGYVLGLAYDRRWEGGLTAGAFCRRRLARLHPFVILGTLLGLVVYWGTGGYPHAFGGLAKLSGWSFAGVVACACALVPVAGFGPINPFNGCSWTLFYEYVGNFLYAVFVRRFSRTVLVAATVVSFVLLGCLVLRINLNGLFDLAWLHFPLFDELAARKGYTLVGGISMSAANFWVGCMRLAFPFLAGLLISRLGWKIRLPKGVAAPLCFIALTAIFLIPEGYRVGDKVAAWRLGTPETAWLNGVVELLAVGLALPLILMVGAGSEVKGARAGRLCLWAGALSYPLYMTHYPFIDWQMYVCWKVFDWKAWSVGAMCAWAAAQFAFAVGVAYLAKRWFDDPIQQWLKGSSNKGRSA